VSVGHDEPARRNRAVEVDDQCDKLALDRHRYCQGPVYLAKRAKLTTLSDDRRAVHGKFF